MLGMPLIQKGVEYSTLCSVDRGDNTQCDNFFLETSDVIAFDLCLDPVQRDFDIQCANNVFFFCAQAASFSVLMAFSSSIVYLNMCVVYNYILVNY